MLEGTMKALVYHEPGKISLDDVPVPKLVKPTDAIARVTLSVICTSDLHIMHGHVAQVVPPKILGHEFCAELIEVGAEVKGFKPGDRVHVAPLSFCGTCAMCRVGRLGRCENGGGFGIFAEGCQAEYIRIPNANSCMIPIPDDMNERDVLLLGDMLGTAWFGVKGAEVAEGQTVAVVGCGAVGMCSALLAKKAFKAGKVIVIDTVQERIDLAVKEGVADLGINVLTQDAARIVLNETGERGVDSVIETAGSEQSFVMAAEIAKYAGIVSTVSVFAAPITIPIHELLYKNLTIRMGIQRIEGIAEMMKLIKDGTISTNFILTHQGPLNDILNAYEIFGKRLDGCIKYAITPYER
jgi:alcohol dehydrogenase